MRRYQALNVEQALARLHAGYKITAAEGIRMFPSQVMHETVLNSPASEVHSRAFHALQDRGYIRLDESQSKLSGQNRYAVWVATDRVKKWP